MSYVVRAVDMSHWGGELTAEECEALSVAGVELVIIATHANYGYEWANPFFVQNAWAAHLAGLRVAAYVWPPSAALQATQVCSASGVPMEFIALDIEAGKTVWANDEATVREAGFRPVIYTSKSQFTQAYQPTSPLWDASYFDGDGEVNAWPADVHAALWIPYGPWTERVGWQFQGTTVVGGQSVDQSVFSREWLDGGSGQEALIQEALMPEYVQKVDFDNFVREYAAWQNEILREELNDLSRKLDNLAQMMPRRGEHIHNFNGTTGPDLVP